MTYDDLEPDVAPRPPGTLRRRRRNGIGPAATMSLLLFGALALLGAVGATFAVTTYVSISRDLPDPSLLEQIELPQQSVILDRTGTTELARFGEFNRETVTFAEIPPILVDATTAVEDRTFWDNAGFDTIGIFAAGLDALRGQARGASTITQQLVRQRLLNTEGIAQTQRSIDRKLREIIQSIRLTEAFPGEAGKQRIMAAYLNQNYYGNESYGVKAAAKSYFGVELKDLTLAQAAILAAIPKAPSSYDLVQNAIEECADPTQTADTCTETRLVVPQDAPIVVRRNLVLDLMEKDRTPLTGTTYSTAAFEAAKQEPVILAPQSTPRWIAPQFVWQVRKELATRVCGVDVETCPVLERGGLTITTTLDVKLQAIAERWVQAAAIVPHAKDPKAAAKALGLSYQSWMATLRSKDLRNSAMIAIDYQTGDIIAYVGSADYYSTKPTPKFQPRFDVLADGWRQPGSAFKPVVYASGIDARQITAATMFMDVVTDFGGGYTPTDADNLERGPVRVRDALRFSLNIPAVKAVATIGAGRIQAKAEAMGVQFRGGPTDAGLSFALGVEEVRPVDLVRAYGTLANDGKLAGQTTIRTVTDSSGDTLVAEADRPAPTQAIDAGAAGIVTDILAGNTDPGQNPYWGKFQILDGKQRRPATLKTGTNNDAKDLSAYGYIAPPSAEDRTQGEYALAVGVWNGNSDNSVVSPKGLPVFSIDVSTYVWQGFLREATKGWAIHDFSRPGGLETAAVDPWTGLAATPGGPSIDELFLAGTAPSAGTPIDARCGPSVLQTAGFEKDHDTWLAADQAWLARAEQGVGVRGGPKGTRTSYFYNRSFNPYGKSWGPLLGGGGCPTPTPSVSIDPCATPLFTPDPNATIDPLATPTEPGIVCPSPSESATPSDSALPSAEPSPTPPPATPTPAPPTTPPTAVPTAAPTAVPTAAAP